jgi:copper chaperone CopZ
MRKTFALIDLDCANCAAKMEAAICKIPGVTDASVSYITQKLTLEAPEADFARALAQAVKVIQKIEPDCEIVL